MEIQNVTEEHLFQLRQQVDKEIQGKFFPVHSSRSIQQRHNWLRRQLGNFSVSVI